MQDIIPPPNQKRGVIRPTQRPDAFVARPIVQRPPTTRPVSVDGFSGGINQSFVAQPNLEASAIDSAKRLMVEPVVELTPKPVFTPKPLVQPQEVVSLKPPVVAPKITTVPAKTVSETVIDTVARARPVSAMTKADIEAELFKLNATPVDEPVAPQKSHVTKVAERTVKQAGRHKKRAAFKKLSLVTLAMLVLAASGYVTIDTWLTNNKAQAIISGAGVPSTDVAVDSSAQVKENEGKDETDLPVNALADYRVGPDLPRALYIDKLSIAARLMPMGENSDGSVQSPVNIFDAGWYTDSVKPGDIGAMFVDAHASGTTRQGLFAYLDTLSKGDTLQVEKGNGKRLTYRVVYTETVALEDVDMKKALLPYGNTLRGLNLMTCSGAWVQDKQTYDHRVIVYTEQI